MPQFHETYLGRKVLESLLPKAVKSLEQIAIEMKRANDLKEKELNKEETSGK